MRVPRALAEPPPVVTIDGQRAFAIDSRPPLPPTLDRLLAEMRVTFRAPVRISGWRTECGREEHRLMDWAGGRHRGHDGATRDLRLQMCLDCESVFVWDVSVDVLPGLPLSRIAARRKNHLICWYSGARRNQREYR